MVIATHTALEIGKVFIPNENGFGIYLDSRKTEIVPENQPIYVIREATRQEWIEGCFKDFGHIDNCDKWPYNYFYEVSTD